MHQITKSLKSGSFKGPSTLDGGYLIKICIFKHVEREPARKNRKGTAEEAQRDENLEVS
jgi:hypothetical protein